MKSFVVSSVRFPAGRLNAPQHARNVDSDDLIELLRRDIGRRLYLGDAGIVDDDIETAQFFFSMINGSVNVVTP